MLAELIWLEAKQVLRGNPSRFFPELTKQKALIIRSLGLEKLREMANGRMDNGE